MHAHSTDAFTCREERQISLSKNILSHFPSCLQRSEAERGVIKDTTHTHCEGHGQVTIIYPEISLVTVLDECEWKLRVKAPNGRLTMQHNKGMGVFEEWLVRVTEDDVRSYSFLNVLVAEII